MNNSLIDKLKSKIRLKISGHRIDNFLNKLIDAKIELLDIKRIDSKNLEILIYKKDYKRVMELKSIYEVLPVGYLGILKVEKMFRVNRLLILAFLVGLALVLLLSNIIFKVEVIHNDKDMRTLLIKELENYDIKPHAFKKSFKEIEKIKEEILDKYKDKIDWLEIENVGTKYVVRLEDRKIIDIKEDYEKRNIVATRSAIIKKVFAKNGVIIRNVNDYVKAGDVVISGEVMLNEEVKDTIKAEGEIYGEVWYNIKVEHPYIYSEKKQTGNSKFVYALKFLNNTYELFNFNKYKQKIVEEKTLLKNLFMPLSLVKQKQREVVLTEFVLTEEEAIMSALEKGRKQMESKLDEDEYIISEKQLKVNIKESTIVLDIFYSVYENITGYQKIEDSNLKLK